jgi:hypothetical protein
MLWLFTTGGTMYEQVGAESLEDGGEDEEGEEY